MSEKEVSITVDEKKIVVATVDAACVSAFYSTSELERPNPYVTFMRLTTAILRLNGLGKCNTKDEVKERIGEAILWLCMLHFTHMHKNGKPMPCKWFKQDEWAVRGPDRGYEEWAHIMNEIREKTENLTDVAAKFLGMPAAAQVMSRMNSLLPAMTAIIHDRDNPGGDIRSLCDMYKVSPRECYESAVLRRKDTLNAIHKKYCGRENQKPVK